MINSKKAKLLEHYFEFGLWLQKLFKIKYGNFNSFVKTQLNLSLSWCQKLRKFSKLSLKYSKLKKLDLPISKILPLLSDIERELESDRQNTLFWQ